MTAIPDIDGVARFNLNSTNKVDLIWQMGLASLSETNNELRLPLSLSEQLTRDEIKILEARLSEQLHGAPTVSFKDLSMNVYRVLRMPEMQRTVGSPSNAMSPAASTSSSISSSPSRTKKSDSTVRHYGKKSKIPRPPNAFILYRQKHHPILKFANPELHNNDISVILGQQWKNEDTEIREQFKALADELKRQHLIKFPDYQYAPRKPSEKKRRMTARKLAKIQGTDIVHDSANFPNFNDFNAAFNATTTPLGAQDTIVQTSFEDIPSLEDILGLNQPHNGPITPFTSTDEDLQELDAIVLGSQAVGTSSLSLAANTTPAAPTFSQNNMAFLDSLIDWETVHEGMEPPSPPEVASDLQDAVQNHINTPHVAPLTASQSVAFHEELERTIGLFE